MSDETTSRRDAPIIKTAVLPRTHKSCGGDVLNVPHTNGEPSRLFRCTKCGQPYHKITVIQ